MSWRYLDWFIAWHGDDENNLFLTFEIMFHKLMSLRCLDWFLARHSDDGNNLFLSFKIIHMNIDSIITLEVSLFEQVTPILWVVFSQLLLCVYRNEWRIYNPFSPGDRISGHECGNPYAGEYFSHLTARRTACRLIRKTLTCIGFSYSVARKGC